MRSSGPASPVPQPRSTALGSFSPRARDHRHQFLRHAIAEHLDELLVETVGETVEIGDEVIRRRALELFARDGADEIALDRIVGFGGRGAALASLSAAFAMSVGAEDVERGFRDRVQILGVGARGGDDRRAPPPSMSPDFAMSR